MVVGKSHCRRCGRAVGWIRLVPGHDAICRSCRNIELDEQAVAWQAEQDERQRRQQEFQREEQARQEARREYAETAALIGHGDVPGAVIGRRLTILAEAAGIDADQDHRNRVTAVSRYLEAALEDKVLTDAELDRLEDLINGLGVTSTEFMDGIEDISPRFVAAMANGGRLLPMTEPPILLRHDERAYLSCWAFLLKDVTNRVWISGSAGVSVRLVRGISMRVGSTRGHTISSQDVVMDDEGKLTVTSERLVFTGGIRAIEVPFRRLLEVRLFEDGLILHLSNRAKSPRFAMASGWAEAIAATTAAAFAKATDP